jgi:membrane associated rhomboid family serine protease
MNWVLVALIVAAFVLQMAATLEYQAEHPELEHQSSDEAKIPASVDRFVLHGWRLSGLFGYMWLHGDLMHILGNLLFLWIFGNAVCAKIGNFKYLLLYLVFGLIAAAAHLIFIGGPMIGASGAIFGVVGMFLIFFPQNDITCYFVLWFFLVPRVIEFTISSYWMILFWFVYNLLAAFLCPPELGGVAYYAHIGGFLAGAAAAITLLKTKIVVMEPRYEKSVFDIIADWRKPVETEPNKLYGGFQRDIEYAQQLEKQSNPPATTGLTNEEKLSNEEILKQISIPPPEEFIRFVCSCGKKVKIPAKFAGKVGRCPACKKQIKIPNRH